MIGHDTHEALRTEHFIKCARLLFIHELQSVFKDICIFLTLGRKIQEELGYYLYDMSHSSYE